MGDYTGFRTRIILKDEFVPVIQHLINTRYSDSIENSWENTYYAFPEYEFLLDWSKHHRCDFIPFGSISYIDWNQDDPNWKNRIEDGNKWIFQCTLKNYNHEIEFFIDMVLIEIAKEIEYAEYWYEYDDPIIMTEEINNKLK